MTPLLQQAFHAVALLPAEDQNALASRLLEELAAEEAFDQRLEATAHRLIGLANDALAEFRAGETLPLDPKTL
jgi:hypothetical protein